MDLSSDLISMFSKAVNDTKKEPVESTHYGKIVIYNGDKYVQLDGSDLLTPIKSTVNVKNDERVTVMIKDHTATVTGNLTSPSASSSDMKELGSKITEFEIVIADKVSVSELEAESARINSLIAETAIIRGELQASSADISEIKADNVTIKETLTAHEAFIESIDATKISAEAADLKYAKIKDLEATNADVHNLSATYADFEVATTNKFSAVDASIEDLDAKKLSATDADLKYATIDDLEATNADVHNLSATYADFEVATTNKFSAIDASIEDLDAKKLSSTDADIKYANIDFTNIGKAAFEYFYANSGLIQNVVIGDGTIAGRLVGVTISGDLIEGNTIVAEKLVIKGTDGLYYKLNTDGVTTEAEQTDYNSLNGRVIKAKSITAEKISVKDLVAFGATIGGFNITDSAIYSGVKESVNNSTSGLYIDKNGQLSLGNSNDFIKYYKDQNGDYHLEISAQSVLMKNQSKTIEQAIEEVEETAQSRVDNLEIGGRNLLCNTQTFDGLRSGLPKTAELYQGLTVRGGTLTASTTTVCEYNFTEFELSDTFTFSFYAKGNIANLRAFFYGGTGYVKVLAIAGSVGERTSGNYADGHYNFKSLTSEWKRYWVVWTLAETGDITVPKYILLRTDGSAVGEEVYVCGAMMEKSNKASNWSPAPEDLATNSSLSAVETRLIDAETSIEQNSEAIELRATKLEVNTAKNEAISTASDDATEKANEVLSSAKSYADSQIKVSADTIALTVKAAHDAADVAQSDIDNLSIGGRNLLLNTGGNEDIVMSNGANISVSGVSSRSNTNGNVVLNCSSTKAEIYYRFMSPAGSSNKLYGLEPGKSYTFSGKAKVTTTSGTFDSLNARSQEYRSGGWSGGASTIITSTDLDDFVSFESTFAIPEDATGYYTSLQLYFTDSWVGTIELKELKLERGNRATDWSPAPEDTKENLDDLNTRMSSAESSIVQLSDSITTNVAETASLGTRMTTVEQTADSLTTTVVSLSVGGRNLIAGTSKDAVYSGNINSGTLSYHDVWSAKTIDIPTETEYIVSFDAKADEAHTIQCFFYSPNTTLKSESSTGQKRTSGDGISEVNVTTEWERYWVKWTQTVPDSTKSVIVGRTRSSSNLYIRAVKFEKGNQATDWSPAPEDMAAAEYVDDVQEVLYKTEDRVTYSESAIQQLFDSIATLITDANGESLMTQTTDGWTFSTSKIQNIVDTTSETLDNLVNEVGDIDSAVGILQQAVDDLGILSEYVKIGTYEDEPCIELGESDSDFKLLITNTRIMFQEGSDVTAYFNNQSMYIKKAVIEEELQQGEFVWKVRSNGNLGLIWKG